MKKPVTGEHIKELLTVKHRGLDANDLLIQLLEEWGGSRQFARDARYEFSAAQAGGQTRQRMVEMMTKLIINNTNHGHVNTQRPEDMTNEEIEQEALELLRKLQANGESVEEAPITVQDWDQEVAPPD